MNIKYRPEIDGLRAIAVISVILYHAKIVIFDRKIFEGGFIGVDIFFVISGYLITSIILKELVTTGKFSFKHFYERRIRRILPALLLVMVVSLPFAWIYLLPDSFVDFSKSILYSLGFSSNFYFHYSGQVYEAQNSLLKPFLHTWSLSVEEQFYILFPVILLISFKYFRKYLGIVLITGFIVSLFIAEWASKNHPSFAFYTLPTRVWEILAGSILAYFEIIRGGRKIKKYKILNFILPTIGLFLIGHSILFFNESIYHPSFYTLSPIIGVCLLIWFSHADELITTILSSKLFVGIGLISYSLYLWHYPIFAFTRVTGITGGDIFKQLFFGIIILFLSVISYYLIERPARNKKFKIKKLLIVLLSSILVVSVLNFINILKKGIENRFYTSNTYKLSNLTHKNENNQFELDYNYDDYNSRKNVLIVGNSHAEDILEILSLTSLSKKIYFNLVSPKVKEKRYNFQVRWFLDFLKDKKAPVYYYKANFLNHLIKQYNNADLIILSTQYSEADLNILNELIQVLKLDNKKIIIFDNALNQTLKINYFNRLDYYVFKNKQFPNKNELKKIEEDTFKDLRNKKDINLRIKEIAKKNKVYLIEREKIFCDMVNERCPVVIEGNYKIYWDHSHVTSRAAKFFAKKFEKNKIFLKYLNTTLQTQID